ncbi:hypothetical protein PILCRDRAFT_813458 [Piloderma croceum F 1598]|uniref:Uncharacterized protein n=1 Tax=Piloderma croceum (strain F 1598) TaxID=765440 RepID=A0A0C3GFW0_PILCF|nr:hypothetical protein PILCRDRAFT_813458 [Piloderma croceum F 1598]
MTEALKSSATAPREETIEPLPNGRMLMIFVWIGFDFDLERLSNACRSGPKSLYSDH